MKANKPVDRIIINLEGRINNQSIGTLFNDEYFDQEGENLDQDLVKDEKGVYAELLFEKLHQILEKIKKKHLNGPEERRRQSFNIIKENSDAINFDNLDYLMKLGEGQFGLVHLVREKRTGQMFALKCLDKKKIKEESMEESAVF